MREFKLKESQLMTIMQLEGMGNVTRTRFKSNGDKFTLYAKERRMLLVMQHGAFHYLLEIDPSLTITSDVIAATCRQERVGRLIRNNDSAIKVSLHYIKGE